MSQKPNRVLSKSRLMRGIQCPKSLWLAFHRPDWERGVDAAKQLQFDEGDEVGDLARKHEGEGTLIDKDYWDFDGAHDATQAAIDQGASLIFEASFQYDDFFARADILKKDALGWHLIEVKKSTQVKEYHIKDSAVQTFIIEACGIELQSISIRHIDSECEFPDLSNLFTTVDITEQVREIEEEISDEVLKLKAAVHSDEPTVKIGPHCDAPFECTFKYHCWDGIPKDSVFSLPGIRSKKKWDLFEKGYSNISELRASQFEGITKRAIEVTKRQRAYIDNETIRAQLSGWKWPLYFFDFETISPAIPRYEATRPYSQVPFQFSCHVWLSSEKELTHFEYLHGEASDPRNALIQAMIKGLGTEGSIVSYNKAFEIGVIRQLAEFSQDHEEQLLELIDRFVDPLPIIKEAVYHEEFRGSFSIKFVAPALLGSRLRYDRLEIGDGSAAQAWADQILRGKLQGSELQKVLEDLRKYCQQDTLAMVELVKWLLRQV